MNGLKFLTHARSTSNYVRACRGCYSAFKGSRQKSTNIISDRLIQHNKEKPKKNLHVSTLIAVTGTLSAATLFFRDDIEHAYDASVRTGRVFKTLAICINELVVFLTKYVLDIVAH